MKALADKNIFTPDEESAVKELTNSLKKLLGERLVKLGLFGSRARGDYDKESDIDIAIIVRGLTRELKDQILNMVADIEFKHIATLSTLVLSEEVFELLKKRERRIALDIEKEGVPL
ncbi:MAG: nucleotidyltransferase [Nitrospirae bacterium RBG_19FT_COMBO_42_15]|nr:MAG: nucleotidyltransferase [Nitrospirae bacterium RBG_19FT_COMBO_42_15]